MQTLFFKNLEGILPSNKTTILTFTNDRLLLNQKAMALSERLISLSHIWSNKLKSATVQGLSIKDSFKCSSLILSDGFIKMDLIKLNKLISKETVVETMKCKEIGSKDKFVTNVNSEIGLFNEITATNATATTVNVGKIDGSLKEGMIGLEEKKLVNSLALSAKDLTQEERICGSYLIYPIDGNHITVYGSVYHTSEISFNIPQGYSIPNQNYKVFANSPIIIDQPEVELNDENNQIKITNITGPINFLINMVAQSNGGQQNV